jgi:3-oxoacyl-[acyl-carrier protein] reductase
MQDLDGQVAIVTGGAQGIGFGIATVLRAEGASVVIADVDDAAAKAAASALNGDGEHALAVHTDVTDRDSVARMAAAAVQRWGRIDILAANAGIYPSVPLRDLDPGLWDQVMAVNARGALFAIQACLPQMTERGYGRIVLTSSVTGPLVAVPEFGHYAASKAAMLGLMRSAALEVIRDGITINAVMPGNIRTEGFTANTPAEHQSRMLEHIPLGVLGEPEDVGWAVRYLASREARYVTGQTLVIDGGQVLPE